MILLNELMCLTCVLVLPLYILYNLTHSSVIRKFWSLHKIIIYWSFTTHTGCLWESGYFAPILKLIISTYEICRQEENTQKRWSFTFYNIKYAKLHFGLEMSTIVTNSKVNSAVEVCNCSSYCIFTYFSCSFIDQSLQSWDAIWFLEMN